MRLDKIKHRPECLRVQEELKNYNLLYPKHCTKCGGWGFKEVPGDVVPYGSTWTRLPREKIACPECEEKNICPRCGAKRVFNKESEKHENCPKCGFRCGYCEEENFTPGEPEVECYCWEDCEPED